MAYRLQDPWAPSTRMSKPGAHPVSMEFTRKLHLAAWTWTGTSR